MTGAPSGPLGRDSMTFADKMQKYKGEIMRNLDAAEILCPNKGAGECIDRCTFSGRGDPDCEFWCRLGAIRDALTNHVIQHDPTAARPIGTCPHGSPVHIGEDEDYIECHSLNECNYRASSDGPHPLCTREAAALALAEEPVTLEGYTGADILKGPIYIDRDTETIFPIVCRDGTTRLVKLTGTCTMELLQQKVKPRHCEFASWLDGYFLCKSQNECEFQEGAGLTFYCGRHDANLIKSEMTK